jgi:outer membrane protein insertion porin family
MTSAVGVTYTHDRRNSRIAPTRGYIYSVSSDIAGIGGDTTFIKSTARLRLHTAFDAQRPAFAEVELGALASDTDSRITDRFFLGGSTFRGFAFGGMGPRDRDTSGATLVDSALGGNFYAVLRLQTSFPLGLSQDSGLNGGVFLNAGTLWGLDDTSAEAEPGVRGAFTVDDTPRLRVSAGFSLFWDSAIGPLRLDFGRAIVREDGDDQEAFRLGAGRRF